MISDACFEVAEALTMPSARPSAVERALNAFADELTSAELTESGSKEAFAELRVGMAAVNRASLPPVAFAAMAKTLQRYFDSPTPLAVDELLVSLRSITATASSHTGS